MISKELRAKLDAIIDEEVEAKLNDIQEYIDSGEYLTEPASKEDTDAK